jgi:hypothetical protein
MVELVPTQFVGFRASRPVDIHRSRQRTILTNIAGIRTAAPSTWLAMRRLGGSLVGATEASLYKGHRYPVEIISHCVWLYHRFALSLRDISEMMLERGVCLPRDDPPMVRQVRPGLRQPATPGAATAR